MPAPRWRRSSQRTASLEFSSFTTPAGFPDGLGGLARRREGRRSASRPASRGGAPGIAVFGARPLKVRVVLLPFLAFFAVGLLNKESSGLGYFAPAEVKSAAVTTSSDTDHSSNSSKGSNGDDYRYMAVKAPVTSNPEVSRALPSKNADNSCPLAFGLGHQKSGTTTVLKALASIANKSAENDVMPFWYEKPLSDQEFLKAMDPQRAQIRKEGHGLAYLEQMTRLCPNMRYYVVRRDPLITVRSIVDRLSITHHPITPNSTCDGTEPRPRGWGTLFTKSNSTNCLERLAHSVLNYYKRVKSFAQSHTPFVAEINYEEYLEDRASTVQKLCRSLEVLGSCNATKNIDTKQYQLVGKNRNKTLEEVWPEDVLKRLRNIVAG